jgi:hypothetical protein
VAALHWTPEADGIEFLNGGVPGVQVHPNKWRASGQVEL